MVRSLAVVILAGCGRIGFGSTGPPGDGAGSGDGGGPADAFVAPNHAFVVQIPGSQSPNTFGGVVAADQLCATAAMNASLAGTYRAYLATQAQSAPARLANARGWVRIDGKPIADRPGDLLTKMYYPVWFDAAGNRANTATGVITGMNPDGTIGTTCNDYTGGTNAMCGDETATAGDFASWASCACGGFGFGLYCFGIDRVAQVLPPAPVSGRRMFALKNGWMSGGGLASADAACMAEATAAGLAGTFRALLSTTTASAASRFSATGAPWVRLDGVPVAATTTAVLSGAVLDTSPDVAADGTSYVSKVVFTGSMSPAATGTATNTCSDWTSTAGATLPIVGASAWADADWWHGISAVSCGQTAALYCLEP